MIAKIGQKYKRKFGDKQIVELIKATEEELMIVDTNGSHFISSEQLSTHFDIYNGEPESYKIKHDEYSNEDNHTKHNINQANRPSEMQEYKHRKEDS